MSRIALGLATLALVLVTGACEDDPEPIFADPTSEPPSENSSEPPTSSPTSAPTRRSPEATVREWVKRRNKALQTGDAAPVRELSSDGCRTCEESVSPIEEVYEAGGYFDTPGWTVVSARRDPSFPTTNEVVAALVYEAGETVTAAGEQPVKYGEEKRLAVFTLAPTEGNSWVVRKILYLS